MSARCNRDLWEIIRRKLGSVNAYLAAGHTGADITDRRRIEMMLHKRPGGNVSTSFCPVYFFHTLDDLFKTKS